MDAMGKDDPTTTIYFCWPDHGLFVCLCITIESDLSFYVYEIEKQL